MTAIQCPVCSSSPFLIFYKVSSVPVHIGILWNSREGALNCPKGDIELAYCSNCGFISNVAFNHSRMEYAGEYENSLHVSGHYHAYARETAQRLIKDYQLHNKTIVEIGSGGGDFLSLLCEMGDNYGIGFDPGYQEKRSYGEFKNRITIIKDYYSENYSHYSGDFICSCNVFEHIQNPSKFLKMLHSTTKNTAVLYFEVPNVLFMLKDLSLWDIIYEHCSYFGLASLEKIFNLSQFDTLKLFQGFGGQFISIEAVPSRDKGKGISLLNNPGNLQELAVRVKNFSYLCEMKLKKWKDTLRLFEQNDEETIVWGAGSKSVSFFNMLQIKDQIKYVVDINPRKQGKYLPGTGQKIISPEELKRYMPDNIIIMNPIYQQEIQQQLESLHLNPRLFSAIE